MKNMNEKLLNRFNRVLKIYTKEDFALYLQDYLEKKYIWKTLQA